MNLAEYEKIETTSSDYLKFEQTGETHYLRFLYLSGGDSMGSDVQCRRKKWDDDNHRYVYDTPDGSPTCLLRCIEYNEDGSNPRIVIWERSAYFCKTVLLPQWKNFPRIIDGVWKVTASNPKTMEATYSLFPVMNATTVTYPIPPDALKEPKNDAPQAPTQPAVVDEPVPQAAKPKKKYWED